MNPGFFPVKRRALFTVDAVFYAFEKRSILVDRLDLRGVVYGRAVESDAGRLF